MTPPFTARDILMASKAEELQALRHNSAEWIEGDYITYPSGVEPHIYHYQVAYSGDIFENAIWLPRLDQLFAMLHDMKHKDGKERFMHDLQILWLISDCFDYSDPMPNIYQMALMLYMRFQFGKYWDDDKEEWVEG